MTTTIEVVGVHPIDAPEPCHLVELIVRRCPSDLDLGAFTQELAGESPEGWQVPWGEKTLDGSGKHVVADGCEFRAGEDVRFVFFFHYLDPSRSLRTPVGEVALPAVTDRPNRLRFLAYEPPC